MEPVITKNASPRFHEDSPGPVELTTEDKGYSLLGVHDNTGTIDGSVMRVRFFVNGMSVDEDLPVPVAQAFDKLVDEACEKRLKELKVK